MELSAAWFLFSLCYAILAARAGLYRAHRAWMLRHIASGIWWVNDIPLPPMPRRIQVSCPSIIVHACMRESTGILLRLPIMKFNNRSAMHKH